MSTRLRRSTWACAFLLILPVTTVEARQGRAAEEPDLLAAEVARWSAFLRDNPATDETWTEVKQATEPLLAQAQEALRDGRRLLALLRLAAARENVAAAAYVGARPGATREDASSFEAEWKRMGGVLRDDLGALSSEAFAGVQPGAVRALAEAALPKVGVYYEASLEYGRNTMPSSGLFYLGAAQAQRDFAAFCRTLSRPSPLGSAAVRDIPRELDALEKEMLAAYRPPASVDRHREFIVASSTLKEARELSAAGLRQGALLRYLQASLRFAPLRRAPAPLSPDVLSSRLGEAEARFSASGVDHSLGQLFLETARADLAAAPPGTSPATTAAIVTDVIPRYLAALQPAPPEQPKAAPRVTVTLVRWPYT